MIFGVARLSVVSLFLAVSLIASVAEATTTPAQIGFYCSPYTQPFTEGGFYMFPSDTSCTYDGTNVPRPFGVRFGGIFRGTIGNAIDLGGNSMGPATVSTETTHMPANMVQGEPVFSAIWNDRNFPVTNDTPDFINYFTAGTPAPHENYGYVSWNWGTETPTTTPPCTENCFSNVAFIPGIKSTELYEGISKRWLPGVLNFDGQRLIMTVSGESANDITVGLPIERAYGFVEIYGQFLGFLDALKSADTIADWKALPYDWRYDVYDVVANDQQLRDGSLSNLANEIRILATTSTTGKVTIIAHSNGGLVAKALIDELGADAGLVDRLVMVGTPQLGTPSTIPAMLHGHEQALPMEFPAFSMTGATAREVMGNMPGAYGLLPLSQYPATVLEPVVEFDNSTLTSSFRTAYGDAIDTGVELQSFLLGVGDGRIKPASNDTFTPTILNSTLLSDSLATRNTLEAWTPPAGIEVVQIVGWGLDTVRGVRYQEAPCAAGAGCNTFLDLKPLLTAEGDATVVSPSAGAMSTTTYFLNMSVFNEANDTTWTHMNMLAATSTQDLINDIITNSTRGATFVTAAKPIAADVSKRLRLSVHSPVTLGVRDALGHFTGVMPNPDPLSDVPVIVQEIPNTYYMEFGEGKYVGFDADEQYTVVLRGTDDGVFTLNVEEAGNGATTTVATYSNVPVSTTTTAELRIQDIANKSALEVDEDNDGIVDESIEPDSEVQTPNQQLEAFRTTVNALDIHNNIKKHLISRSFAVEKALAKNKKNSVKRAKNILSRMETYIRHRIDKRRGILPADAQVLIDMLRRVREGL
jgi:pimeloyl-ACP methyl ester carboxylesterase